MKNEPALHRPAHQTNRRYSLLFLVFVFISPLFLAAQQTQLKSYKANDKYGFKNDKGIIVVEAKYDRVFDFKEGMAPVILDKKYGFVDKEGKEVIPAKFQAADYFKDNIARIQMNDKWGLIDSTGQKLTELIFDEVHDFTNGLCSVKIGDFWEFIDTRGNTAINQKFTFASQFSGKNPIAWVSFKFNNVKKSQFINKNSSVYLELPDNVVKAIDLRTNKVLY